MIQEIKLKEKLNSSPIYTDKVIRQLKKELPLVIVNSLDTFQNKQCFAPSEVIGIVSNIHVKSDSTITADATIISDKINLIDMKVVSLSLVGLKIEKDDEEVIKIKGFKFNEE